MAISGGNLINSFPIYDTSKSVGTYTANLQRQANQRAAEQKALQDDLGKIKIDGLRDADKEDYFKGFEDWRTTAQQAAKERDFRKKAELQSASDRKYLELQSLVNKSKEYNKIHQDVSGRFLDDKFRDQFTDDAVDKWRKSGTLPLSSKDIVLDPTALGRQMDLSGVNKVLTDVDEDLLKQAKYANPTTRRITSNNRAGTESIYSRSVDPKQQIVNYGMLYDTNRDVRNYMRQQFPEQFASMPEDQAKAFALTELVKQRPVQRQDAPKVDWDLAPDKFYEHWDYQLRNPKPRKGGTAEESTLYRQKWINDMFDGVKGSGEELKAAVAARGEYNEPLVINTEKNGIIKVKVPSKNIMSANENGDVKMKVIPSRVLTFNTKYPNDKVKMNALISELTKENINVSKFKTGEASGKIKTQKQATTPNKTVPVSKIKSLVGKKGYEGYSEKELMDYYKSQGYNIQ